MISILKNKRALEFKSFTFPSGEVGFKLNAGDYRYQWDKASDGFQTIVARINNSNDLMELAMAVDALKRFDNTPIRLFLPKVPYAQQDRICDKGESFSLKVLAKFIKNLDVACVVICDPHSDVVFAVFDALDINVYVISQFDIINKWLEFSNRAVSCLVVAPDLGADKKTSKIAQYFGHSSYVSSTKLRDLSTGEIIKTEVFCDDFKGRDIVICDDICLGGKTFIELAKACKSKNCGKIILYVTHGVFNNGVDALFNNGIDEIWTTDSFKKDHDNRVKVLNLEEKFLG